MTGDIEGETKKKTLDETFKKQDQAQSLPSRSSQSIRKITCSQS